MAFWPICYPLTYCLKSQFLANSQFSRQYLVKISCEKLFHNHIFPIIHYKNRD